MVIAGVMSGSSLDGLDIAILHFGDNDGWELLWSGNKDYSEKWVDRLRRYQSLSAVEYVSLITDYSRYISQNLAEAFNSYSGEIDYIGFHGHTLIHLPQEGITEQIGRGGIIAALLNIPTVTDFRIQDVVKGGVGTPLAPLVELNLFQGHDYYLNLGGIANITILKNNIIASAYDVCPCNQVLNYYSNLLGKEFDDGGRIARTGSYLNEMANYLDSIPFFELSAPKSLDNNYILEKFIPGFPSGKTEDVLHTYSCWMAKCIAGEIEGREDSTSLMVSGGGAHNTFFMECLKAELEMKHCTLHIPAKEIIDYKEAMLMALMARKYLLSEANIMSIVTGASSDSIGGALYKVLRK